MTLGATMSSTPRTLVFAFFTCLGLGLGLACKSDGSQAPGGGGQVLAVEGDPSCPRSVPSNGASCPRGESGFCVYRTTGGDFACACGRGQWGCGKK